MSRRVLFAIRSKLGDTLISYACVRAYVDAHPDDQITLLTRSAYCDLLTSENGLRVIGFNSRIGMFFKLLWLRLTTPAFDVLAVLWGSGAPVRRIGQWVDAKRKIAWSKKMAPDIFEESVLPADCWLIDPAASTIRMFDPNFSAPQALRIPSLVARRAATSHRGVGIVPVADELRRNLDGPALLQLIDAVRARHPFLPIYVFVNPVNQGAETVAAQDFPENVELRTFSSLSDLVTQYMELSAWYGTDTGLYHLAVACGIPATVFFGPTQPHKIVMPAQPNTTVYRLAVLGSAHCDVKSCTQPLCLHASIAAFAGLVAATPLAHTPSACPLRAHPLEALSRMVDHSPAAKS
jgi:ADP-heptose:LPS heptosyltransferase